MCQIIELAEKSTSSIKLHQVLSRLTGRSESVSLTKVRPVGDEVSVGKSRVAVSEDEFI